MPPLRQAPTVRRMMVNSFKEISIRGRLAYGATCLERALAHHGIRHELVQAFAERTRRPRESSELALRRRVSNALSENADAGTSVENEGDLAGDEDPASC